jgi:hypothetical protein
MLHDHGAKRSAEKRSAEKRSAEKRWVRITARSVAVVCAVV